MRIKLGFIIMLALGLSIVSCSNTGKQQQKENKLEVKKMNTTELTLAAFKEKVMDFEKNPKAWVFKGNKPAIIDFYATWCGPCKATAPVLDSLAGAYKGKIDVYKVDVEKEEQLAAMFGVQSIPSLLFIPMKGEPKMQMGAMNHVQLEDAIKKELLK